jgi:hypothetical protein
VRVVRPLSARVARLLVVGGLGLGLCACSYVPAGALPERDARLALAQASERVPTATSAATSPAIAHPESAGTTATSETS